MKITCVHCDTPFETTNVTGKYIFCPWCGKRLLNPKYSEKKSHHGTMTFPKHGSDTATITTLFDDNTDNEKLIDIFGRPINSSQLVPRKRTKIRLFIKRTNDSNSF